ncbi:MAG: RsbRD N-terminal domain-containing protein, partial [Acidobacteriota bacterium]|nr:RsbRD N-terminal domain-containing protein [Acidobacteriota bacterium]
MPQKFTTLVRQNEVSIVRAWVDEMYAERRTELTTLLSYEQLVECLPEMLEELSGLLDCGASDSEIQVAARRLRAHPQVRFHQGALMDEVARELMVFRRVFSDF